MTKLNTLSFSLYTRFLVAMLFGVLCAMSILNPWCIVAGIWQFTAGFIIIVIEVNNLMATKLIIRVNIYILTLYILYVQEVVTQPKILNQTFFSNLIHVI